MITRVRVSLAFAMCLLVALAGPARSDDETPAADSSSAPDRAARAPDAGDADAAKGRLESMVEQLQTMQTDLDKLKRIKLTGYLQARWEHAEDQADSVKYVGKPLTASPANKERFYIRRARLKLTYDSSPLTQAVIYLDGGQDRTIRLLEAYLTLFDPWTPDHRHAFSIGQFNVPFGYELERSSSVRELPERSRAENVLFSGERDRGLKLVDTWTPRFETTLALLNGGGINSVNFPTTDPTSAKDWLARARYSQGRVDVALSWYQGHELTPLTGPDASSDKTRFGADAQGFYELPTVGGGSVKAEVYSGRNVNADAIKKFVTVTDSTALLKPGAVGAQLSTDVRGGYAMWVQNLGTPVQVVGRYDVYDPDTHSDHDQFHRASLGLNYFYDGFTRISVAYDITRTDKKLGAAFVDPQDNLWTIQFQHKF